jgi:hypothetical protein
LKKTSENAATSQDAAPVLVSDGESSATSQTPSTSRGEPRIPRRKKGHLKRDVQKPAFLRAVAEAGTITSACHLLRIDTRRVYEWQAADPQFAADVKQAQHECLELVVGALFKRAKTRSDPAAFFLLKKLDPGTFGDTPPKANPNIPPPQQTTFNVANIKLHELSDEGLDLVDRMVKGLLAGIEERERLAAQAGQPLIDVPSKEPRK